MTKQPNDINHRPALAQTTKKIKLLFGKEAESMKHAYAVGLEVQAVRSDPNKYGKGAVELIADALGCTPGLLYQRAKVAATWTPTEFSRLSSQTTAKEGFVTFSHFVELAKAPADQLEALFKRTLKECLSVRDLAKLVAAGKLPSAGPSLRVETILGRLIKVSDAGLKTTTDAEEHLQELLAAAATPVDGGQIHRASLGLRKLADHMGRLACLLDETTKRLETPEENDVGMLSVAATASSHDKAAE